MEKPSETRRLRHFSIEINPREAGLQPYPVAFTREESPPVTSMLEEGVWYTYPERHQHVIVWAKDEAAIAEVLTYHYGRSWHGLQRLLREPTPCNTVTRRLLTVAPRRSRTEPRDIGPPHRCGGPAGPRAMTRSNASRGKPSRPPCGRAPAHGAAACRGVGQSAPRTRSLPLPRPASVMAHHCVNIWHRHPAPASKDLDSPPRACVRPGMRMMEEAAGRLSDGRWPWRSAHLAQQAHCPQRAHSRGKATTARHVASPPQDVKQELWPCSRQ